MSYMDETVPAAPARPRGLGAAHHVAVRAE